MRLVDKEMKFVPKRSWVVNDAVVQGLSIARDVLAMI